MTVASRGRPRPIASCRMPAQKGNAHQETSVMKVFISFQTADVAVAESLYERLSQAGASVYQFRRTARPGTSAWTTIIDLISDSDVFIALVSKSSLKSRAVNVEVEQAHYEHVNNARPSRLIPVLLESDIRPPK